jgi:NAD(P)-dependent dehydrogenase (short-subunit alcohol dehydrogenase family)
MSKVWLITGCSRGLGRAFAEAALANGDQVAATARQIEDLAGLKQRYGEQVSLHALDVTNETQAETAVQITIQTFGRLDVLVNNAGYGNVSPVEDTSLAEFRAQIETNLFGVIILTKAVLPYFRERRSGRIIQITSTELRAGRPEYDSTVGATARFQESYNGKQPGDPAKAAAAILTLASIEEPPLRIVLGSDAYAAAEKNDLAKIELGRKWKDLSCSTDLLQ